MAKKGFLIVLIAMFFWGIKSVCALDMPKDEVPDESYIIGSHLFSRDLKDDYNSSIYGNGRMTAQLRLLGASSIDTTNFNSQSDFIIYYKDSGEDWRNSLIDEDLDYSTIPSSFYISHINGECVLEGGCGSSLTQYSVKFYDYNDTLVDTASVAHGSKVEAGDVPSVTREGYKFSCWSDSKTTKSCYGFGPVTSAVNLYAYYEPITLTLTYNYKNTNGTSAQSGPHVCNISNTEVGVCKFDIGQNLPTVPSGETFIGWSTKPDSASNVYHPGDSILSLASGSDNYNINLYAVYEENTYNVIYNLSGGGYDSLTTKFTKSSMSFPFAPTKKGYYIDDVDVSNGSYDDGTITISTYGTSQVTVSWKPIVYSVKNSETNSTTNNCQYDSDCNLPTAATLKGQEFEGYSLTANGTERYKGTVKNLTVTHNSTVSVYPHYKNIDYDIYYDMNGGALPTDAVLDTSYNIDNLIVTLPTSKPTKVGYTFKGWKITYNDSQASAPTNTFDTSYQIDYNNSIGSTNKGSVTFTAQFEKITYKIYYDGTQSGTCNAEATCTINKSYSPTGNSEFVGWGSSQNNPTYIFKNGSSVSIKLIDELSTVSGSEHRVNLYHSVVDKGTVWAFITYDLAGGTFVNPDAINSKVNITNGSQSVTFATINERPGFTFAGWTIKNEAGTVIANLQPNQNTYTVSQNITVVANWNAKVYPFNLVVNGNTYNGNYTYGSTFNLEQSLPSSVNTDNLIGWSTTEYGNIYYGVGVQLNSLVTTGNTTPTLYAIFDLEDCNLIPDVRVTPSQQLVTVSYDILGTNPFTQDHYVTAIKAVGSDGAVLDSETFAYNDQVEAEFNYVSGMKIYVICNNGEVAIVEESDFINVEG